MIITTRNPFLVRKVNSKNSLANGIKNAAAMIPMMVKIKAVRNLLSGLEIQ